MDGATAPQTYAELCEVLRHNLPEYAPGQARIARLLLDDLPDVAIRNLEANAKAAHVHSSSIVRFAKSLGFEGYPALERLCRERLRSQVHLTQRFDAAAKHPQDGGAFSERTSDERAPRAAHFLGRDIELTFAGIDADVWDRAIELVANAPSVYIVGLQKCFSPAYLCSYLLHMARNHVYLLDNPAGDLLAQIRDIKSGDVLVAMSIRQYTRYTVETVQQAKRAGATIVAITDVPSSPLAAQADCVFFAQCEGPYVFRSLVGIVSIVEALAGEVSLRLGENTRSQLLHDEQLISDFGLYYHGDDRH
jgi:DNA-binding MurR/RpiR family transcriptional regulator